MLAASALAACAALWLAVDTLFGNLRERALNGCLAIPPGKEQLALIEPELDWEWTPPGWACVYRDHATGRVIARERR